MDAMKQKIRVNWYLVLLCTGFLGLYLPSLLRITRGIGLASAVWLLSFLLLTGLFPEKRQMRITAVVFLAGYVLKYAGTMNFQWVFLLLFAVIGLIQFGVFYGYALLLRKQNRLICTLAFPLLWLAVYYLAMLLRFPSLLRADMLFADMNVLLQSESLLGSAGLSFVLLWVAALLAFSVISRRILPGLLGTGLYLAALTVGMVYLYPNVTYGECVRVAMATGPYVGDYMDYTSLPAEEHLQSLRRCTADAAAQGAALLIFNEETYEIDDTEEERFLEACSAAARENGIHMLVGLDLRDTDGSEGGLSVNKVVWIDSGGALLGSYVKRMTIPVLESDYVRGDGVIPSHTITLGDRELRVSYLICYDSNFPQYVRQMDPDTDILFLPSWDWAAVTEQHALLCRTLAVENRVSIVKPTYDGVSIAVRPDGTVIESWNTNDLGYEKVKIVEVPAHRAGGAAAETVQRENYISSILGVEIISILICLILLYGSICETRDKTPRNRLYSHAAVACLVALTADAVSWIFDGCVRLDSVLVVSTVISLFMIFIINGIFLYYFTEYIRERKPVSTLLPRIYSVFAVIVIGFIVGTSGTGLLFRFENGVYHEGPLYTAYVVMSLLCSVLCMWSNLQHIGSLNRHDGFALMSYIILPTLAGTVNLYVENFCYAYPAIVLSLVLLYVMIQSERQERLAKEGSESYYQARHDRLTGLLNRLAYEERLAKLAAAEEAAGAVFTDLNGLKHANDNFGHEAGDRLLKKYAELLCCFFRRDDVFRISGDEFTVLPENMDEPTLLARTEAFRRELNRDGIPMASVGLAFGRSKDINKLIRQAETAMYVEKDAFHAAHPEMTRK